MPWEELNATEQTRAKQNCKVREEWSKNGYKCPSKCVVCEPLGEDQLHLACS
jgi:hypothetical protein